MFPNFKPSKTLSMSMISAYRTGFCIIVNMISHYSPGPGPLGKSWLRPCSQGGLRGPGLSLMDPFLHTLEWFELSDSAETTLNQENASPENVGWIVFWDDGRSANLYRF